MPGPTPELRVRITKRADGRAVLRCERADGSVTWQRQDGPRATFFPFHDLTHYSVETTFGFRLGFFGLIADGWDIDDTGGKGRRGRLPAESGLVEHVVGLFDRERIGGAAPLTAAEFAAHLATAGLAAPPGLLTDARIAATRARIDALHEAWGALAPDATLELDFDRSAPNAHR